MEYMDRLLANRSEVVSFVAVGSLSIVLLWLQVRFFLPTIMQDEYVYLNQILMKDSAAVLYGNHLFTYVYGAIDYGVSGFYQAIKILNVFWMFVTFTFIYLTSRRFLSTTKTLAISAAWLLAATSLYAGFLLPEPMYFAFSSGGIFFILRGLEIPAFWSRFLFLSIAGAMIGLASLVKPHALLLAIAVSGFFLFRRARSENIVAKLGWSTSILVSFLICKYGVGYALAGNDAFSLFGKAYDNTINEVLENLSAFYSPLSSASAMIPSTQSGLGVQTALLFFLATSLVTLWGTNLITFGTFSSLGVGIALGKTGTEFTRFIVWITLCMIFFSAAFVTLAHFSNDPHDGRVVLRYLEFLAPFILTAALVESGGLQKLGKYSVSIAAAAGVLTLLVGIISLGDIAPMLADSPTLYGIYARPFAFGLTVAGSLVILIWSLSDRVPRLVGIWTVTTLLVCVGVFASFKQTAINGQPFSADYAGMRLHSALAELPGEDVIIVGTNRQNAFIAKFWSRKTNVQDIILSPGETIELDSATLTNFAVVVELPNVNVVGGEEIVAENGFRIILNSKRED